MNNQDIIGHRLIRHQIAETAFTLPEQLVSYYGAMQAQDYAMAKWAIGLRLKDITEKDIDEKFNSGKILRTHILRPTWHFIAPENIRWMLSISAPRVHQANGLYYRKYNIDGKLIKRTVKIFEKVLQEKHYLTREEINSVFEKEKIKADRLMLAYIFMHAELEQVICSGPRKGKQFTYALMDERVTVQVKPLSQEEAIGKVAKIYFASRGPATLQDFTWWSGLTVKDARRGIEMLGKNFEKTIVEKQEFFFQPMTLPDLTKKQTTFLVPDYDEYGISYKNRAMYHHPVWSKKEKKPAAEYYHAIAVKGYFGGTWSKKTVKNKIVAEVEPYNSISASHKKQVDKAAQRYYDFFND